MRKLLLSVVAICFVCVLVSPALSAEPEKVIPGKNRVFMVPAKIVVINEAIAPVTDPEMIKALEKSAKDNECVLAINIPGGDRLYIKYCGSSGLDPGCVKDGTGKLCCPGRVPLCQ
jgi:hypothetical protein